MTRYDRAGGAPAAITALLLGVVTLAAQDNAVSKVRSVVSTLSAPGIDRGLGIGQGRPARRSSDPLVRGRGDASRPYLAGSLIVKFRPGTTPVARQAMLASVAGSGGPGVPYANFDIVAIPADMDAEAAARRLAAQPDVEYAQPRYRVRPLFVPNDPFYTAQWNYTAIDMERAWDINQGATPEVTVAVLDTGVAYVNRMLRFIAPSPRQIDGVTYPALGTVDIPFAAAPELGPSDRFVAPYDFIWDDDMPVDMDGHGTHVAGTIGQLTNNGAGTAGMAFNVRIMPVKVIDGFWDAYFGSPFIGTDDVVARGIRYAVDSGAHVLNLSIGRTGPPAPVVQDAIAYAVSRGAFVSVAGGNEFTEGNSVERLAEFAPQINGMVAVAAIGRDRRRASYSTTGSYIELAAPGGDIARGGVPAMILQQTYDFAFTDTFLDPPENLSPPRFDIFAYFYLQGTSMAAPHVSALAAMLRQQGITSPAAMEANMKHYASDLGPSGRDDEYGYGLINPRSSLRGMGLAR
jgi:serine protease